MQREPALLIQPALLDSASVRHLLDNLLDALDLPALQRRIEDKALEIVQLVGREEAIFVRVDEAEDAREGGDSSRFKGVLAGVVERCGGMKDSVLGEEEDFRDVEREEGGTLDAGLRWKVCQRHAKQSGGSPDAPRPPCTPA